MNLNKTLIGGPRNVLYVLIDGSTLWAYDETKGGWRNNGLIKNRYQKLENDVRGGVKCKRGYSWFFKSN